MKKSTLLLEATIPLPPSVNHSYAPTSKDGKAKFYMVDKSKRYKRECSAYLAGIYSRYNKKPYEGAVALFVDFYFPDKRRRDKSNMMKILEDCLHPKIIKDDSQILFSSERVVGYCKGGRVEFILDVYNKELIDER